MAQSKPLERIIETIAPEWAERRALSRHNLAVYAGAYVGGGWETGGYSGGSVSRRGPSAAPAGESEDKVTGYSYDELVGNIMALYRNDPVTRSVVNVVSTYMGESRPEAMTSDPEFNDQATAYFNDFWWKVADSRRRPGTDFGTLQKQWTTWSFIGGDMIYALVDGGLYPYEGIQLRTPYELRADKNIVSGIRIQPAVPNRFTHYYICEDSYGKKFKRIAQNQAIYAPNMNWRTAMVRPAPELHAVVAALRAYASTIENVADKIRFESMLISVEKKGALGNAPGSRTLGSASTAVTAEWSAVDYGMRFKTTGNPDQDFKLSEMNNPGAQYVPYMEHMARVIAAGVGLPMEAVLHLYTNGSYTANRAARTDLMKFLLDRWSWRNKVLCQPCYNLAIARAIKSGEIKAAPIGADGRSEWHKCTWTLPHIPQIDEGKEIAADIKKWGAGQDSIADWGRESGRSREQLLNAHDIDVREMKARAEALGVPLEQYMGGLFSASAAPEIITNGGGNA